MNGPPGTAPCHLPAIGPDTPARRLAGHCPECQHSSNGNTVRHQHHAPTFAEFATGAVKPVCGTLGRLGDGVITFVMVCRGRDVVRSPGVFPFSASLCAGGQCLTPVGSDEPHFWRLKAVERSRSYTCVVTGAGVRLPQQHLAILNAAHKAAPDATIAAEPRVNPPRRVVPRMSDFITVSQSKRRWNAAQTPTSSPVRLP